MNFIIIIIKKDKPELLTCLSSIAGACAGFLKGVGSEVAAREASCGKGPRTQPPEFFLTEFYAKPIGYQYRRFKAVDKTL